ncbi:protein sprouty homolog 2 [Cololabis saira]|uniref:protein sprouty homolog 2 n=1 Tax=Cololabis saira TaxID=129043 RepID=UPI002AD32B70|nr:protein sprouty homolog 2 [Cololabis saira]
MDSRSQSDSDGGGGRQRGSPSPTELASARHDEGRPQPFPPQTDDGPPDPWLSGGQPLHAPPVLSLDQLRRSGSSNEYTEGPTAAQRSPATQQRQQKSDSESREERPNNLRNLTSLTRQESRNGSVSSREGVQWSGAEDSRSSIRTSVESTSSSHRLLGSPTNSEIIRIQPKRPELASEELKPLGGSRTLAAVPGSAASKHKGAHSNACPDCGRCTCAECRRRRVLPSCWMCGQRCVCSADNAVEYGTCVCCVKGLFYHCSSDDEDTCADKPFSCSQSHRCARWTTISFLSLLFPCLLCYLPAKGCVAACQSCYDRAARPGCRCTNSTALRLEDDGGKPT